MAQSFGSVALLCLVHRALGAANCIRQHLQVLPSETGGSSNASDGDAPHWVAPGKTGPLWVFLPGTDGHPAHCRYLFEALAGCQSTRPIISLSYAFQPLEDAARNEACEHKYGSDLKQRAACLTRQHSDTLWGGGSEPGLWPQVLPRDSVAGRLALLLKYLASKYPLAGWGHFLDAEDRVIWGDVVIGGHSQGAGLAGYLAQTTQLRGAVLLSAPADTPLARAMPSGRVSNWNFPKPGKKNSEGYGFVRVDEERGTDAGDLFLYADDIKDSKLRSHAKLFGLKNGTRVRFDIKEPASARKSRLAVNVLPAPESEGGGRGERSRSRSPKRRRSPSPRRTDSRDRSPVRGGGGGGGGAARGRDDSRGR